MFGKLMKHESFAMGRILLPLWGVLLLVGLLAASLTAVTMHMEDINFLRIAQVLLAAAFFIGCAACEVVAFVLMISRFRSSVLTDRGYLTNTLPVSVHEIVLSKLLTVFIFFLLTSLAVILSLVLAVCLGLAISGEFSALRDTWQYILSEYWDIDFAPIRSVLHQVLPWYIASGLLAPVYITLHCYAAMSIGHAFANHKKLLSFVFFFLIAFAVNSINSQLTVSNFEQLEILESSIDTVGTYLTRSAIQSVVTQGILAVIFYFVTVFCLKKKLNLD